MSTVTDVRAGVGDAITVTTTTTSNQKTFSAHSRNLISGSIHERSG